MSVVGGDMSAYIVCLLPLEPGESMPEQALEYVAFFVFWTNMRMPGAPCSWWYMTRSRFGQENI